MKRILSNTEFYFSSGSNNIDFSSYPDFQSNRLLAVINITVGQTLIYATGGGPSSPTGGSFLSNYLLSLTFNTGAAGMADTDTLQIIYDQEESTSIDIVSGKSGSDFNLLNSSFGGTVGDVMPSPFQDNALSIGILNGGVLESPAMNVNNELIVDVTQSGPLPISLSGSVSVANFPATQAVTGTFFQATQPVSAASLPLPSGASTSALQTTGNTSLSSVDSKLTTLNAKDFSTAALQTLGNAGLTSIDATLVGITNKTPTLGQKPSSGSSPVVIASDQSSIPVTQTEIYITGQATLTAGNNIFLSSAGTGSSDAQGFKSGSVQILSSASSGTIIFEHSNDNLNWQFMPVFRADSGSPNAIVSAVTSSVSSFFYHFPIKARYIRCRIGTVLNATNQAYLRLSQESWSPIVPNITNATAANLNATVSGALTSVGTITTVTGVTTVSSITAASLSGSVFSDIASATIATTQTSANITTVNQSNMAFQVSVTATSGTGQFMDVSVQETFDGITFWDIYQFQRITAIGQYQSPQIRVSGSGIRYVRTVGGTTPSFTSSVSRPARQTSSDIWRNFVNRTIDPNTLNSTTPSYLVEGCDQFQLAVTMNAGGTSPIFKLEGSNDNLNWYSVPSTTLTATVGASVQVVSAAQSLPKFIRGITSTAGVGSSLFCLCITGRGV
jgi:hypothetical protein